MDEKPPLQLLSAHTNMCTHTHTHKIVIGIREMDEESLLTRELDVSSLTLWEKNKQQEKKS